jgi:pyruvate dehydrogenase E1 component beta subunit
MTTLTMAKALNAGLRRALEADPKVLLAGEDIGKLGGVFRITEGLQADFGRDRVVDSPLAEAGIIGTAVGLALRGYRPVVEIQFDGFVWPGFDQITSQLSRLRFRSMARCRSSSASLMGVASGRSSTTRSRPSRTSPTHPG